MTESGRPLNPGVLVSELYERHAGSLIIVVGGGPSAPQQLELLRGHLEDAIIVSANYHAWGLGLTPHYTFCKDHEHTEMKVPMEGIVRRNGVPVVTRHYWGDYRAAHWPVAGNSGMMAIALAVMMGGTPVVPIGIDCFQDSTYYHSPRAKNVSLGRGLAYWHVRLNRLRVRLDGGLIRVLGGPMGTVFPPFRPHLMLPPRSMPPQLRAYADMPTYHVRTLRAFQTPFDARVEIPAGIVLPVDLSEYRRFTRLGLAEPVGDRVPPVDGGRPPSKHFGLVRA